MMHGRTNIKLLHFSHDPSNLSSPSFSSTTFLKLFKYFWRNFRTVQFSSPHKAVLQMWHFSSCVLSEWANERELHWECYVMAWVGWKVLVNFLLIQSTFSYLWAVELAGRQFWNGLQQFDVKNWTGYNLFVVAFVNTGMALGSTTGSKIIVVLWK